jgi:hypothetical protein
VLLDAPDPLYAVAHELAEWEARMDVLAARLHAFEQRISRLEGLTTNESCG